MESGNRINRKEISLNGKVPSRAHTPIEVLREVLCVIQIDSCGKRIRIWVHAQFQCSDRSNPLGRAPRDLRLNYSLEPHLKGLHMKATGPGCKRSWVRLSQCAYLCWETGQALCQPIPVDRQVTYNGSSSARTKTRSFSQPIDLFHRLNP